MTQSVATEPGQEYVLQFAYTALWEAQGAFDVLLNGVSQGAELLDGALPGPSDNWTKGTWAYAKRTFTAVSRFTDVEFSFPPDLGGYVRLDDVRLNPADDRGAEMTVEWTGNDVRVEEGASVSLTVRRTGRLDERGFATVEMRSGTAQVNGNSAEADVVLDHGTSRSRVGLTFQPGQAELAVTVRGRADAEAEAPETATLHLLPTGNASVQGNPATVTVITPPTRISVTARAREQTGRGEITLQVVNGSGGRVRVQTTAEGSAKPEEDFIAVDTELSLTAALPPVSVPITVLSDSRIEGEETIGLRITALSGNTEVVPTDLLFPLEDDPVQVVLEVDWLQVSEADGVVRFSLVRTGALDSPQVFHVGFRAEGTEGLLSNAGQEVAAARSGSDYLPMEGQVEFGPGVSRQTVEVTLPNDTEADGPRGLRLGLLGSPEFPNVPSLGSGAAFVVIE
ncbi:MAG: Calx-beta domain-containing protein, partial [Desulfobacterales bacterium]|nr:Calx-beta domain-containing protein [Desulfobacterales bacterium]